MMDVFEKIHERRKRYESYLPIIGAFGLSTIHSLIRQLEHPIIKVMIVVTFLLTVFRYIFVFRIHGIDEKQKYHPKINKRCLMLLTLVLILSLEIVNYLIV